MEHKEGIPQAVKAPRKLSDYLPDDQARNEAVALLRSGPTAPEAQVIEQWMLEGWRILWKIKLEREGFGKAEKARADMAKAARALQLKIEAFKEAYQTCDRFYAEMGGMVWHGAMRRHWYHVDENAFEADLARLAKDPSKGGRPSLPFEVAFLHHYAALLLTRCGVQPRGGTQVKNDSKANVARLGALLCTPLTTRPKAGESTKAARDAVEGLPLGGAPFEYWLSWSDLV